MIDNNTVAYFENVLKQLDVENLDLEHLSVEQDALISSVFKECEGIELDCVNHQGVGRQLEAFVSISQKRHWSCFIGVLSKDWESLFNHKIASRVLERFIHAFLRFTNKDEDFKELLDCSSYIHANFVMVVSHQYASHVFREVFGTLATLSCRSPDNFSPEAHRQVKKSFRKLHNLLLDTLDKCTVLRKNSYVCGVLIDVFDVLNVTNLKYKSKLSAKFVALPEAEFNELMTNQCFSPVIEKLISVATEETIADIWANFFSSRLLEFSKHSVANFVVQRFLTHCKDESMISQFMDELGDRGLAEILNSGRPGVIVSLAECLQQYPALQKNFIKKLSKALHCKRSKDGPNQLVLCCAYFMPDEDLTDNLESTVFKATVNLQGSLIVQKMLNFQNNDKVVKSFFATSVEYLVRLICDQNGCHIIDAFVKSNTIANQKKDEFSTILKGHLLSVATDKYGSRCFDNIWAISSIKQQTSIAEELAEKESELQESRFGKFIARNCGLSFFRTRRDNWIKFQQEKRKRESIVDFLADSKSGPVPPKRRKPGKTGKF